MPSVAYGLDDVCSWTNLTLIPETFTGRIACISVEEMHAIRMGSQPVFDGECGEAVLLRSGTIRDGLAVVDAVVWSTVVRMEAAVAALMTAGEKRAKLDELKAEAQAKLDDFLLKNRKQGRPTVAVAVRKRILMAAISRLERGFLPNESEVQTKKSRDQQMRGSTLSIIVRRRSCSHQVALKQCKSSGRG